MLGIKFLAPEEKRDLGALANMLAAVWTEDSADFYRDEYIGNSHYDWQTSRLALLHGAIVSHWGVWGYDMRVGSAKLRTAGVGAVATREDQRQQGLMTKTGNLSLEAMRQAGYDLSVLHGYTKDYARFGYVRAWTYTDVAVSTSSLPSFRESLVLSPIDLGQNDEAIALYNLTHATFSGTAVRPTYRNLTDRRVYGWSGVRGELAGYVLVQQREASVLHCLEAVGVTETILAALRQLAEAESCGTVAFTTLPDLHPVRRMLRGETAKETTDFQKGNGWMVRTVSLIGALSKLQGELEARLTNSHLAYWEGNLLISDGRETVSLKFRNGALKVMPGQHSEHQLIGGDEITQLLIGTSQPLDIAAAASVDLTGDAADLIAILFPAQQPSLAAHDQV